VNVALSEAADRFLTPRPTVPSPPDDTRRTSQIDDIPQIIFISGRVNYLDHPRSLAAKNERLGDVLEYLERTGQVTVRLVVSKGSADHPRRTVPFPFEGEPNGSQLARRGLITKADAMEATGSCSIREAKHRLS
jgi:hypothetical protein